MTSGKHRGDDHDHELMRKQQLRESALQLNLRSYQHRRDCYRDSKSYPKSGDHRLNRNPVIMADMFKLSASLRGHEDDVSK
jgi:hypothetical protein